MEHPFNSSQRGTDIFKTKPFASNYNLVCKNCTSGVKFTKFDDFMQHSREQHGPIVRPSALSIIIENGNDSKTSAASSTRESNTLLSTTRSGASTTLTVSTTTTNVSSMSIGPYDLKTLNPKCLVELIQLLNKCFCIWHKPTRFSVPRIERFHAYKLLLAKLRTYQPDATFRDGRSIVRQLIRNFKQARKTKSDLRLMMQQNHGEVDDSVQLIKPDPIISNTYIDQLMFLSEADCKDVEELVPDKLCSFCSMGFHNTETLWTHMVSAHVPQRRDLKEKNLSTRSNELNIKDSTAVSTTGRSRRRRSKLRNISDNDTDFQTDQSLSDCDHKSLRRSRRKKKTTRRHSPKYGSRSPKRTKRSRRTASTRSISGENTETDNSVVEKKPSSYYLSEYSDEFLEQFINLYRQQETLWQQNCKSYKSRKCKAASYDILLKYYCEARGTPTTSLNKLKYLIRRIRSYYERMNRPNANAYRSHIWQLMAFIEKGRLNADSSTAIDYDCTKCMKRFKRAKYFAHHLLKAHPPTDCTACGEVYANADDLRKHLLWFHRRDKECPLCHDGQPDWKASPHMSKHFYDHRCPTCPQVFHDITNYQRHKFKCRSKNRFHCAHCDLTFGGTLDFRRHSKAFHQDERPFKCEHCEITFKYMSPLTKHRRLHKRLQQYL